MTGWREMKQLNTFICGANFKTYHFGMLGSETIPIHRNSCAIIVIIRKYKILSSICNLSDLKKHIVCIVGHESIKQKILKQTLIIEAVHTLNNEAYNYPFVDVKTAFSVVS